MGFTSPNTYCLTGVGNATSPLDSTTYYLGFRTAAWSTSANQACFYFPRKGTIRAVLIEVWSSVATGTAEDWTMILRYNAATDYTIMTLGAATPGRLWYNYNLNIPCEVGEKCEMKTTTPAWVTNPDGCYSKIYVFIECA